MAVTTFTSALATALQTTKAVALAEPDPVDAALAVRAVVEFLGDARSDWANLYAIVTYTAQRARCSCGESFSQTGGLRAHLAGPAYGPHDGYADAHVEVYPGAKYSELAKRLGIDPSRVNQLITRGRALVEGDGQ